MNIKRTDMDKKLFRSADVGERTANHAWVEIQTLDGQWIPVDPSIELTGTTIEGMEMFKEADYVTNVSFMIDLDPLFNGLKINSRGATGFDIPTGESNINIDFEIGIVKPMFGNKKIEDISNASGKINVSSSNVNGNLDFKNIQFS